MSKYPLFKLNDLASEWCKGQPFKKTDIAKHGQTPCIHYGELFTKYGVVINQCLSKTDVQGKRLSVSGDILFPASDVTPSGLARCSALMQDNVILGGDIIIMRPRHGNDPRYLSYAINYQKEQILQRVTGALIKHLSGNSLKSVIIPVPPLVDQVNLVSKLEKISALITFRKLQLEKIDQLASSRFMEMFGEPGTDPFGWGITTLGKCCELNPRRPKDIQTDVSYSFVAMPSVDSDGHVDASITRPYSEVCKGFTYFAENDVLFAKITPCMENGKGGIAKGLMNGIGFGSTEFHVLRPIDGTSDPYWLYTVTMLQKFRTDAEKVMTGTGGQRRVPINYLSDYKIALPPIGLQKSFAAIVQQTDKSKLADQIYEVAA